jgi:preprotein translocase subunit YajC
MNWPFIIFFSIVILALVIFLVMRNQKDERKYEDRLKNDYRRPLPDEKDI